MTFSIAGRCVATGRFGVAIASSSPAVAARCAHVRAGIGAACSQNVTDPRLGPLLLDAIAGGAGAAEAIEAVTRQTFDTIAWRQLTVIGRHGPPAAYTGSRALGRHGSVSGVDVVVAGNLLRSMDVLDIAVAAFGDEPSVPLAERLVNALEAARDSGGEEGPVHSAGLVVVDDVPWPVIDLRVDWADDDPVAGLRGLWARWAPEEAAYRRRVVDPGAAPGYGVPGDDRPGPFPAPV